MSTSFPLQHHRPWSGQFDGKNTLCTNKASHKNTNAHRYPIETLLTFDPGRTQVNSAGVGRCQQMFRQVSGVGTAGERTSRSFSRIRFSVGACAPESIAFSLQCRTALKAHHRSSGPPRCGFSWEMYARHVRGQTVSMDASVNRWRQDPERTAATAPAVRRIVFTSAPEHRSGLPS